MPHITRPCATLVANPRIPLVADVPIIAHEDVAEVDCCGCLFVQLRGDEADITYNECGSVVRTVPAHEAAAVMECSHDGNGGGAIRSACCPHCGALNLPGFSAMDASSARSVAKV